MAEVLGTWAGLDRKVGAVRRWLLDKPEMEREALAEELVDDGRVWLERPRVVEDLRGLLAEIDRRWALHRAARGSQITRGGFSAGNACCLRHQPLF